MYKGFHVGIVYQELVPSLSERQKVQLFVVIGFNCCMEVNFSEEYHFIAFANVYI